jgi:hypothetical protein
VKQIYRISPGTSSKPTVLLTLTDAGRHGRSHYNDAPRGDWSNGEDGGLQNRKSGFDSLVPR